jgi:hypothetical protein
VSSFFWSGFGITPVYVCNTKIPGGHEAFRVFLVWNYEYIV